MILLRIIVTTMLGDGEDPARLAPDLHGGVPAREAALPHGRAWYCAALFILYYIMLCYVMLYYIILHDSFIMLYYIVLYYMISYYTT